MENSANLWEKKVSHKKFDFCKESDKGYVCNAFKLSSTMLTTGDFVLKDDDETATYPVTFILEKSFVLYKRFYYNFLIKE